MAAHITMHSPVQGCPSIRCQAWRPGRQQGAAHVLVREVNGGLVVTGAQLISPSWLQQAAEQLQQSPMLMPVLLAQANVIHS